MDSSSEQPKKVKTGHSNFRKYLTDYNDGENVTNQLGNDDYDGNNLADPNEVKDNPRLDGKEALGNDLLQDDDMDYNDKDDFV